MSLASAIRNGISESKAAVRPCRFGQIVNQLEGEDREAVLDALTSVSTEKLAKLLSDEGYPIGRATISRHIRGLCYCPNLEDA